MWWGAHQQILHRNSIVTCKGRMQGSCEDHRDKLGTGWPWVPALNKDGHGVHAPHGWTLVFLSNELSPSQRARVWDFTHNEVLQSPRSPIKMESREVGTS